MTLKEFFTAIADAIRETKGTTKKIVAEDFPSEIKSISGGGKTKLQDGTKFTGSTFTTFNLSDFDISDITDTKSMLSGLGQLVSADISNSDLSNVDDMSSMFSSNSSLTTVNLSNIKTMEKVRMGGLFSTCPNLTTINFSNINKHYPFTINTMFSGCSSLTTLDLNCIYTDNVTTIQYIFRDCSSLVSVDISHFNLEHCTGTYSLQNCVTNCSNLSNESMNSILKAFSTAGITSTAYKRLSRCGFTQEQAEICITLSNWPALEALGWATGY